MNRSLLRRMKSPWETYSSLVRGWGETLCACCVRVLISAGWLELCSAGSVGANKSSTSGLLPSLFPFLSLLNSAFPRPSLSLSLSVLSDVVKLWREGNNIYVTMLSFSLISGQIIVQSCGLVAMCCLSSLNCGSGCFRLHRRQCCVLVWKLPAERVWKNHLFFLLVAFRLQNGCCLDLWSWLKSV